MWEWTHAATSCFQLLQPRQLPAEQTWGCKGSAKGTESQGSSEHGRKLQGEELDPPRLPGRERLSLVCGQVLSSSRRSAHPGCWILAEG